MFFIASDKLIAGAMLTCRGPFATKSAAIAAAEAVHQPGDYTVYGPAEAVHKVSIAAPVVNSTPVE